MRRFLARVLSIVIIVSLTGCLATVVQSPRRGGLDRSTTRAHIIALPIMINAPECTRGLANVRSWVPLWGLAVGILTFGIIVPVTTAYSCTQA